MTTPTLPPGIADAYPLSPMQQGMLFHALYEPQGATYVEQVHFLLSGHVDADAYQAAWQGVVDRHEALRTSFEWDGLPAPRQLVHERAPLPFERLDWSDLGKDEQDRRFRAFLRMDRQRGFDLARAPLMRVTLVRLADDLHRLVWSFHHVIFDGWSSSIILRDVELQLRARRKGAQAELPPARPYGDFIRWLQTQDVASAEPHWRRELAGLTAPTLLARGVARSLPPGEDTHATYFRRLPEPATADLDRLARSRRVTLNTVVQAAYALALGRVTGEDDVCFGSAVSGRPASLPGVDGMVGLFINTVPVRARIEEDAALDAWLATMQEKLLEARQHEHVPLFDVLRWSDAPKGQQLFDTLLVFENYPWGESGGEDAGGPRTLESAAVGNGNYPLALVVIPGPRLTFKVTYDRRAFLDEEVAALVRRLETVLASMAAAAPDAKLASLAWVDAAEARDLAERWNATDAPLPDASLAALFRQTAARHPDLVAVKYGNRGLTYAQLDRASDAVAATLAAHGVRQGDVVGIATERDANLVAGIVGIVKAGAAYLPLDAEYPAERVRFMLEDAGARVVLAPRGADPARVGTATLLALDEATAATGAPPAESRGPRDVAYVMYTSGSTGQPKGILVPHEGVARLVLGTDYVKLGPGDVVAQASNASFDAATFEVWGALLTGAALVGADRDTLLSPRRLATFLRAERVTTLFVTTALFNQVAREAPDAFAPLTSVLFGGEAVDPESVRAVLRAQPPRRLLHVYGPTEATTFATWHLVTDVPDRAATVPIGLPIRNTRAYVLDAAGRPVPPGTKGELYVSGPGVALGYLNRPDLTRQRFLRDPYAPGEARMYRTGDLVRRRADGAIEFVGRADGQVKVRGYRIELGEVEAAFHRVPEVSQVVALAREDVPGQRRIVAYVVLREGAAASSQDLRGAVRGRLPDYMVPAAVVTLPRLPLTPNGKVDRKALPRPEAALDQEANASIPPRDPTEEIVAGIWAAVLGRSSVGVRDNFFDLGGQSLLATRVISEVNRAFGVDLPIRALFQHPTVEGLCVEVVRVLMAEVADLSEDEAQRLAMEANPGGSP